MTPAQKKAEAFINAQVALMLDRIDIDPVLAIAMLIDASMKRLYDQGRLDGLARLESAVLGPQDLPIVKPRKRSRK